MALLPRTLRRDWGAMVVWLRCPLLACHPGAVGGRSWAECEIRRCAHANAPTGWDDLCPRDTTRSGREIGAVLARRVNHQ